VDPGDDPALDVAAVGLTSAPGVSPLMKIALLAPYPRDPGFTRGGVEKVTYCLVEGLKERDDVDIHVVALTDVPHETEKRVGRVTIHCLPRQNRLCLPTFSALSVRRARCRIRSLRPDLVHCQESGLESFIAAGLPFPSVVTIHAIFRNEAPHYPGLRAKARYAQIGWMHDWAEARIDRYIPSSAYAARELEHLRSRLLPVIENPIDRRWFDLPQCAVRGRILFAGTMYPRKGVHNLIAAMKLLRDRGVPCTLHVTGQVLSPEYFAQVREAVQRDGLGDVVTFRGLLTEDEMAGAFAESSLLCLPSYAETSPMAVGQAMAAGKPIVASGVGGLPWLVEEGVSGLLVEPGDVEGLARALTAVLTDEARRNAMGEAARRKALARFEAGAVAEQTVQVYRQVLAERGAGR
jgi:glycosyltransferase involved in cell wall biosynthesis